MDANVREKIHKILDLVIDRNEGGDSTFFHFEGHVNEICVEKHEGKWFPNSKGEMLDTYLWTSECEQDLDEVIKALC